MIDNNKIEKIIEERKKLHPDDLNLEQDILYAKEALK